MPALDNPRWEKFCEYFLATASQIEAYSAAFGNDSDGAGVNASKLMQKQPIQDRLMELRKLALPNSGVLAIQEKRRDLAAVWRTPVGDLDERHHLAQKVKRTTRTDREGNTEVTVEIEAMNKLKALELDAKLAGELNSGGAPSVRISMYGQGEVHVEAIEVESETHPFRGVTT